MNLEYLILFQIKIFKFENMYDDELVPLRKYRIWVALKELYKLFEENL